MAGFLGPGVHQGVGSHAAATVQLVPQDQCHKTSASTRLTVARSGHQAASAEIPKPEDVTGCNGHASFTLSTFLSVH